MIKFFRHIRKALIEKNQMGKYFKYAIGEILLVVIGILIALQINNWNENRKQTVKSKHLIERLKKEVAQNIEKSKQKVAWVEDLHNNITALMHKFGENVTENQTRGMDTLMDRIAPDYVLGLNLNTLTEARENGEISLISNDVLRDALYQLSSLNDLVIWQESVANDDNNNFVMPFLYKNTNRRNVHVKNREYQRIKLGLSKLEDNNYKWLLSNREFESILNTRFNYSVQMLYWYKHTESYLKELSDMLNNETL